MKDVSKLAKELFPELRDDSRPMTLNDIRELIQIGHQAAIDGASEGFEEYWETYKVDPYDTPLKAKKKLWQAARLSMEKEFTRMENAWRAKADQYLNEMADIATNLNNAEKQLADKDAKITELEEKFKAERNDVLYMDRQVAQLKKDLECLINILVGTNTTKGEVWTIEQIRERHFGDKK